jgi:hypothetical protein
MKMKVMVIVKANKDSEAGVMPSEQLLADMGKYNEEIFNAGILLAGEGLQPSSHGVRVMFKGAHREVIAGPFTETNELIAGFWIWKVESMEQAIEWVKRCPIDTVSQDGSHIEIRRVFETEDFAPSDPSGELREAEHRLRDRVENQKR